MPLDIQTGQVPIGHRQQNRYNVGLHPHQQRLTFRISEAGIELKRLQFAVLDHQAGVQNPAVGATLGGHAVDSRAQHLLHRFFMYSGSDNRSGGVGTHSAGVGSQVAVENRFVILGACQWYDPFAVSDDQERSLFAG